MVQKMATATAIGLAAISMISGLVAIAGRKAIRPKISARTIDDKASLSHRPLNAAEKNLGRVECSAIADAFAYASAWATPPLARRAALAVSNRREMRLLALFISVLRVLEWPFASPRMALRQRTARFL